MNVLLIDPYVYQHLNQSDICVVNTVAHIVSEDNEDINEEKLVETILAAYKPGMKARALLLHVKRELSIKD